MRLRDKPSSSAAQTQGLRSQGPRMEERLAVLRGPRNQHKLPPTKVRDGEPLNR